MVKKVIAFIILLTFICIKCITWVPSACATGIPAFDAFYYAVLQTLGMAYTNGVEMDLAPAIAEVREAVPDYLQQPDVALKYLLRDYAGKAWDYISFNWENSSMLEDVALAETSAIGLANASGVSIPTLQDIVTQWGNKALDNDNDITTPIDTNTIAFWNKFNKLWINQYLQRVNYVEDDSVQPTPDIAYENYLNKMNTTGFFFRNYPASNVVNQNGAIFTFVNALGSFSNYSWFTIDNGYFSSNSAEKIVPSNPVIIFVTSNNGVYSVNQTVGGIDNQCQRWQNGSLNYTFRTFGFDSTSFFGNNFFGNLTKTLSYSGTLQQVLNYLSNNIRNITLFVDGVLWMNGSFISPAVSEFNSSVPNGVIDSGTDDGKIVANPIYWVVDNNTGMPIDSQINLDKFIDFLNGIIDGTNEDTSVDFGDLVDAGVIEKQDGTAITDADVIAVPIADVIDDAITRADPISIPVAITGSLPPLPPLPPFFPTPDFPEGDPTSGFNGMSVLARIINITNQSLPDGLIITFYGVIFGAVVLGLIKILHK